VRPHLIPHRLCLLATQKETRAKFAILLASVSGADSVHESPNRKIDGGEHEIQSHRFDNPGTGNGFVIVAPHRGHDGRNSPHGGTGTCRHLRDRDLRRNHLCPALHRDGSVLIRRHDRSWLVTAGHCFSCVTGFVVHRDRPLHRSQSQSFVPTTCQGRRGSVSAPYTFPLMENFSRNVFCGQGDGNLRRDTRSNLWWSPTSGPLLKYAPGLSRQWVGKGSVRGRGDARRRAGSAASPDGNFAITSKTATAIDWSRPDRRHRPIQRDSSPLALALRHLPRSALDPPGWAHHLRSHGFAHKVAGQQIPVLGQRRGGRNPSKIREATLVGADGVVGSTTD
jgi:hypothetical protein